MRSRWTRFPKPKCENESKRRSPFKTMKLPPLHFDWFTKHDPYTLMDLGKQLLQPLSKQDMVRGTSTKGYDATFKRFGGLTHGIVYAMELWDRCGQQVYVVGPKVADALRRTSLRGVTPDMLTMERGMLYIALPNCPWKIWGGARTKWHNVSGFYCSYSVRYNPTTNKPQVGLYFYIWGAPNERSDNPLDDVLFWFSVPLDDCPDDNDLEQHYGGTEVEVHDDIFGTHTEGVFSAVRQEFGAPTQEEKDQQRQMARNVFRLSVNLILYLQSEDAEVDVVDRDKERAKLRAAIGRAKKEGKRKKLRRRLDNMPRTVFRYIGPKMERALEEAERKPSERETVARVGPRRHLVRPHWRHYWVGSGENKRRVRRWIALFERGKGEPERTVTVLREGVYSSGEAT